jgi:iron complex transport system substrate-binding protein
MWRFAGIALLTLLAAAPTTAQEPPKRIASINLCTDQLLLALSPPERILGLSRFARDAATPAMADAARALPQLSGTAEELLVLRPDLIVAGRYAGTAAQAMATVRGLRVEVFDVPRTLDDARTQIRRMAALVGEEAAGEHHVAAIDAALARLRTAAKPGLVVLPYARRGWMEGRATLMGELMREAGLTHADAQTSGGRFVGLETLVTLKPDALLTASARLGAADQGEALLSHPAVAGLFPPERRIAIPDRLVICGGPPLADAIDQLAAALQGLTPRAR